MWLKQLEATEIHLISVIFSRQTLFSHSLCHKWRLHWDRERLSTAMTGSWMLQQQYRINRDGSRQGVTLQFHWQTESATAAIWVCMTPTGAWSQRYSGVCWTETRDCSTIAAQLLHYSLTWFSTQPAIITYHHHLWLITVCLGTCLLFSQKFPTDAIVEHTRDLF